MRPFSAETAAWDCTDLALWEKSTAYMHDWNESVSRSRRKASESKFRAGAAVMHAAMVRLACHVSIQAAQKQPAAVLCVTCHASATRLLIAPDA